MPNIFILKSWSCDNPSCVYVQNFPQTRENIAIHFMGEGLSAGQCPSCKTGTIQEISGPDLNVMSRQHVDTDEEIDKKTKYDNQQGKEVPISDQEKQDAYLKRNKDIEKTQSLIYSEV